MIYTMDKQMLNTFYIQKMLMSAIDGGLWHDFTIMYWISK